MYKKIVPVESESDWEMFVLKYAPQSLFQSWTWGELQKRLGNSVSRWGMVSGGKLIAVWQSVLVPARRGTFLHVRHGPIFAKQSVADWEKVLSHLRSQAKKSNAWFVRMNPLVHPADAVPFRSLGLIPAAMHAMDAERCWVLDLAAPDAELMAGMRKTTRYEIRRAAKEGIEIVSTTNPAHLPVFFDLYKETSTRHGFVPHTGIREEFELFARHNQAVLYIARHQGKPLSAAIILYYGHQAIYHHGASVPSPLPVSYPLQWEAILDAKKRGMKVYNFWGIAPEDSPKHPWRGITLFKKGFGGREIEYIHAQDLPVSPMYAVPRAVETVRRLMRGYD
jgi:lipid II:glycine glycyltransferase (peptidoglycan interpeptide bridge formation enzyme)